MTSYLIECRWLSDNLNNPDISVVDASWYLPGMTADGKPRNGRTEYNLRHIKGAVFFDIDEISDPESPLPHTVASQEYFAGKVGALGISEKDTIVVYDGMGLFSAPRVWWNFKTMGAENVFILNGGLPEWMRLNLPLENKPVSPDPVTFNARFNPDAVATLEDVKNTTETGSRQILDARSSGRFTGKAPEPRPGLHSGHMPGALSLPFDMLIENGKLRESDDLEAVFKDVGADLTMPVITSCGSGITAAILTLALDSTGHKAHTLYDGSWTEWGSRDDTTIVSE